MCFPNSPEEYGGASIDDPMCLDKEWQSWAEAWQGHKTPGVSGTGIAYMLKGDKGASNTDPYASGPTKDNHWVVSPPHIMVLPSDPKVLDAYPTDPKGGGALNPRADGLAWQIEVRRGLAGSHRDRILLDRLCQHMPIFSDDVEEVTM